MENNVIILNGIEFPECSSIQIDRKISTGQRLIPIRGERVTTFESSYTFTISWEGLDEESCQQMNSIFNSPAGIMLTCHDAYSVEEIFNQKKVLLKSVQTKVTSNGTDVVIVLEEQEKVTGIR